MLNNPINLIDPSGHCGGDPSNNSLFDQDGNIHLDCTIDNFQNAPIQERLDWINAFMAQSDQGQAKDWFNNIQGIIEGFVDFGLSDPGTWLSHVDAVILHAIQDGYQMSRGNLNRTGGFALQAAQAWETFFNLLYSVVAPSDKELIQAWGTAEGLATEYGVGYAYSRGRSLNQAEQFFLLTGDIYRSAAANNGLGPTIGEIMRPLGVFVGINDAMASLSFEPLVNDTGYDAGYAIGEFFNDPRSKYKGHSPVYWYSTFVVWGGWWEGMPE